MRWSPSSRRRGAKFTTPPDVEFKDDAEFEKGLLADFDEQREDLEDAQVLYHALGLLPADVDLAETMKSALGLGVVGYYDPETKEMVVRGTEITPYVRTVLAHELTHAFDDQRYNLTAPSSTTPPTRPDMGSPCSPRGRPATSRTPTGSR